MFLTCFLSVINAFVCCCFLLFLRSFIIYIVKLLGWHFVLLPYDVKL